MLAAPCRKDVPTPPSRVKSWPTFTSQTSAFPM